MENKDRFEKLKGKTVMVHPFLTTDPADHRGHIGTITAVSNYKAGYFDVSVRFNDGCGRYDAYGLLILSPVKMILKSLINEFGSINTETRKDILQVSKLISEKRTKEALRFAMKKKGTESLCVINCQDWIEIMEKQALKKDRRQKPK